MDKYILQATYCNYNYGSILQCYALQLFLKKYGIDCYLVKQKKRKFERIFLSLLRRIGYMVLCIKYKDIIEDKKKQVDSSKNSVSQVSNKSIELMNSFNKKNIKVYIGTLSELKKKATDKNCIFCVAGSDQIWNSYRIFIEPLYFLRFAPSSKRIAFSPSFGGRIIPDYNIKRYSNYLSGFSKISVREKSGIKIVKQLIGKDVIQLMDPVFLVSKEQWMTIINNKKLINENYVLAFFLDKPSEKALNMLSILSKNGYKIIELGYKHEEISDSLFLDGDPSDFIAAIANSAIVCTDSFHATAFSVLFHKAFYSFQRNYQAQDQSSRLIDFLKSTNLIQRYDQNNLLSEELDFSTADSLIANNYASVMEYLEIRGLK